MVDEASLGLAPTTTEMVFEALARLGADGLSILLVEQNARASLEIADRAYVLERGALRLSGTACRPAPRRAGHLHVSRRASRRGLRRPGRASPQEGDVMRPKAVGILLRSRSDRHRLRR